MIELTLKEKILDAAWQYDWTVQPEKFDGFRVVSLSRPGPKKGNHNNNRGRDDDSNTQYMDIYLDTMVVGICPNFALCGRTMLFLTDLSDSDKGKDTNTIWEMMKNTS